MEVRDQIEQQGGRTESGRRCRTDAARRAATPRVGPHPAEFAERVGHPLHQSRRQFPRRRARPHPKSPKPNEVRNERITALRRLSKAGPQRAIFPVPRSDPTVSKVSGTVVTNAQNLRAVTSHPAGSAFR
jgi:hypothetical protein